MRFAVLLEEVGSSDNESLDPTRSAGIREGLELMALHEWNNSISPGVVNTYSEISSPFKRGT